MLNIKPFRYKADIIYSVNSLMPFKESYYYKIKELIRGKIVLKGEADTRDQAQAAINHFLSAPND